MSARWKAVFVFLAGACTAVAILFAAAYILRSERSYSVEQRERLIKAIVQSELREIVLRLEYFNLVNARYPTSLLELRQSNDHSGMNIDPHSQNKTCVHEYYYFVESDSQGYILRSAGPDQKVFTVDDIVPRIEETALKRIGLKLKRNNSTKYPEVKCYERDEAEQRPRGLTP